ncbi:A24 family peptidase, partial [Mycobacteroides abscessus]|uniref:A24 family peptidase n=1 Tax=Mycobacteroides abscessus TaxID=36809 RepID=UPI0019D14A3D
MIYGAGVAVLCWMTALSYFDIRYRRLPNWLTLPAAVVIITVGLWGQPQYPA